MKSVTILTIAAMAMAAAAGCSHDTPTPSPEPPAKGGEFNEFGFTTTVPVTLCVDYGDMDGMPSNVYFEVYDTCPVEETETAYARIAGTEPLYAGYTDGQGRFEGTIELPAYIRKAYVLTPAFYARTLLEATRSGDMLTASAESGAPANAAPASTRAKEYHSTAVERDGWKTWLGSYDTTYGSIGYEYDGDLKVKNYGALLKAHASVFDTTKKCPKEYRSSRDLYLEKSAEVVITLLGSNTCWNSSDGLLLLQDRQQAQVARRRQCGDDLPQHAGRPVEQLAVGITALSGRGARHSRTADLLSRNRRRQQGRSYDRIPGRLPHRLRTGHQRMDQPAESRRQKVPRRDFRRSERQ